MPIEKSVITPKNENVYTPARVVMSPYRAEVVAGKRNKPRVSVCRKKRKPRTEWGLIVR